jgi:hypothetical protein
VNLPETAPVAGPALTSQGYHITVDDGRDSFYAISIEDPDAEDAYVMSDTVYSLDEMR